MKRDRGKLALKRANRVEGDGSWYRWKVRGVPKCETWRLRHPHHNVPRITGWRHNLLPAMLTIWRSPTTIGAESRSPKRQREGLSLTLGAGSIRFAKSRTKQYAQTTASSPSSPR